LTLKSFTAISKPKSAERTPKVKISLSEARDIINNWKKVPLPVKVSFRGCGVGLLLRGRVLGFERDLVAVGVEGTVNFFIPLASDDFDLEDTAEAPEDLRAEAMSRTVRILTYTLPSGAEVYFYELWADVDLKAE
jgi:hypothetical protein